MIIFGIGTTFTPGGGLGRKRDPIAAPRQFAAVVITLSPFIPIAPVIIVQAFFF